MTYFTKLDSRGQSDMNGVLPFSPKNIMTGH
jgi:hypothetical protein